MMLILEKQVCIAPSCVFCPIPKEYEFFCVFLYWTKTFNQRLIQINVKFALRYKVNITDFLHVQLKLDCNINIFLLTNFKKRVAFKIYITFLFLWFDYYFQLHISSRFFSDSIKLYFYFLFSVPGWYWFDSWQLRDGTGPW